MKEGKRWGTVAAVPPPAVGLCRRRRTAAMELTRSRWARQRDGDRVEEQKRERRADAAVLHVGRRWRRAGGGLLLQRPVSPPAATGERQVGSE
jgi:hypothetical protein